MADKSRYKLIWGVLILFGVLNLFLLFRNVNLHRQLNITKEKLLLKNVAVQMSDNIIRYTPINSQSISDSLRLIALFTDVGCGSCVKEEITYLHKWQKQFKNNLIVYYKGNAVNYLEGHGATFNYYTIKSADSLFSKNLPLNNPIVLVIDQNNIVQAVHTNDLSYPGSYDRRANFYKRISSLFETVK